MFEIYKLIITRNRHTTSNPVNFIFREILFLLSSLVAYFFIKIKSVPNKIDLYSILISIIVSSIFLSSGNSIIIVISSVYFIFIDLWDIVDGTVARYLNKVSPVGYYFDILAQTFNYDIALLTFSFYTLKYNYNNFSLITTFLFVFSLTFRFERAFFSLLFIDGKSKEYSSEKIKEKSKTTNYPRIISCINSLIGFIINLVYLHIIKFTYLLVIFIELFSLNDVFLQLYLTSLLVLYILRRLYPFKISNFSEGSI